MHKGKLAESHIDRMHIIYNNQQRCMCWRNSPPFEILKRLKMGRFLVFIKKKGLPDYGGLIKGTSYVFDVKECKNKNSIPLSYIEQHQYDSIMNSVKHGGIGFILVYSHEHRMYYYLDHELLKEKWETWKENPGKRGYASVAYSDMTIVGDVPDYLKTMCMLEGV